MRALYAPLFFFGFIAAALSLAAQPLWLLPLLANAVLQSCSPTRTSTSAPRPTST
ncbi:MULTISPECIES: hypothetical protein [Pseudomonas]|uniref:hypothetical protein n=1 Tax=Pseudomonas TaxID=286 RepID=UPI000311168A|nr:hypothetical protein [Pseudomonas monteilii]MCE0872722.1 hypothetical protein [Pseudomonas monteilii]MCE0926078.1 hypothetical protein [Pseudomonas monteilii]MCE0931855.1 hypothetical protein [Pseudomonas monteilii]MCE1006787.1 hypothetical protein [Pseudomonas monteilii]MCE1012636.1 hypothetical protein [Pseudomonas monteilii]